MRNRVLLENCVVSLEPHTFVSVLQEKQEQIVRKQVGTTFRFVAEKVTTVAFNSFCNLSSLKLSARTVELYSLFTEIFVLHAVVQMCLLIPLIEIIVLETCVYLIYMLHTPSQID